MYSHKPVREGRDSSLVMPTPCRASGASSSYTAPGRFFADSTRRFCPAGGRGIVLADHQKTGGVVGLVLDILRQLVPGRNAPPPFRRRWRRPFRPPPPVGPPRHCSPPDDALHARQILVQPLVALGQGLGMGIHLHRLGRRARLAQQKLVHAQIHLAANLERRLPAADPG